ncbi:MAG: hypothetical protein GXP55_17260, partial [Deltaproteobacteria bacterium]|nr:hypothetical protein [Deltaproteobacteria bacterium]
EGPGVYVEAFRYRADGGVSSVMIWDFAGSRARLRRFIERRAPLATRFDSREDDTSTYSARFVAPHRVRVSRGAWPSAGPGAEAECRAALGRAIAAGAFEVSFRRRSRIFAGLDAHSAATRVATRLLPAPGAVRSFRRETYRNSGARDAALAAPVAAGSSLDQVLLPPSVRRDGPRSLLAERSIRFHDLALLAEDDADMRRALLADQRAHDPLPVDRVHVEDRDALERQLTLRRLRLELSPPDRQEALRHQQLELLRRGRDAHPADASVVLPFARLTLELDHDFEGALAALDVLAAAGSVDPQALRPLRREALSYASEERLVPALVRDLSLPPRVARRAARDLVAAREAGTVYETAEGLWLAQHALSASALRASGRAPRGLSWPLASLPESAAALIDQAGLERPLYVVVRASALRGEEGNLPEALGPYATLHFDADGRGVWVLGATTRGSLALARLGALLDSRVSSGELELMVAIVPFGTRAERAAAWLHVVGRVEGGRLLPRRISLGGAPRVRWSRVAPLLADPLAAAGPRVFPAPILDLVIRDPERAQAVADSLDPVASCASVLGGLSCRPRADRGAVSHALGLLCRASRP